MIAAVIGANAFYKICISKATATSCSLIHNSIIFYKICISKATGTIIRKPAKHIKRTLFAGNCRLKLRIIPPLALRRTILHIACFLSKRNIVNGTNTKIAFSYMVHKARIKIFLNENGLKSTCFLNTSAKLRYDGPAHFYNHRDYWQY